MAIANGINKKLIAKKQSGLGVKAVAAGAQYQRRVTSTIDLSKETYESSEILDSQQVRDMRHGTRKVDGSISAELSGGTYQGFVESAFRALASNAVASSASILITSAVTTGAEGTFTSGDVDWVADGWKAGLVFQITGYAAPAEANNAHNFRVISATTTVLTVVALDGVPIEAKAAGDSVTFTSVGKHIVMATANHTKDYWTIEHDYDDIVQAEQFTDCVIGGANFKLPPTGLATADFPIVGLNMDTSTSPYFTSPTPSSTGAILAASQGKIYANGLEIALITGFEISMDGAAAGVGAVVGSDVQPDIQLGRMKVSGNMTVLFQDAIMRDHFINETEISVIATFLDGSTADAESMTFIMTRVKVGGATKDDGEKALVLTVPFTALEETSGAADKFATTLTIQDSSYV